MHAFNKPTVDDVNSLFHEQKLNDSLQQGAGNIVAALKDAVTAINQGLKTLYQNGAPVENIVCGRAALIDRLLTTLYQQSTAENSIVNLSTAGFNEASGIREKW